MHCQLQAYITSQRKIENDVGEKFENSFQVNAPDIVSTISFRKTIFIVYWFLGPYWFLGGGGGDLSAVIVLKNQRKGIFNARR